MKEKRMKNKIIKSDSSKPFKRKINFKLIIYSLLALGFIILAFTVNPYFMILAAVFMIIGQKEMWKKKK
jgi:1,4-dihydroxy-2-naphthoate octaprenyltransferase